MNRKEIRITIRLSSADFAMLETRMADAGYQFAGAFIRDFVVNNSLKPKISANTVAVARELGRLAAMIRARAPASELLEEIRIIALVNMQGVR
jgi:hypothetical protein